MDLSLRRFVIVVVLLLAVGVASAQQPANVSDVPSPPAPGSLKADWWSYFDTDAKALPERIRVFEESMDELRARVQGSPSVAERDSTLSLIDEVKVLAARYGEASARSVSESDPLPPPAERYGPGELLQVATNLREARLELEFESDEAARQGDSLSAAHDQINTAKAAYLNLPSGAPERWADGLAVIRDRLAWAIRQQDLRLRRARIEALQARARALQDRLAVATSKLSFSAGEIRAIRGELDGATKRVERLKREASALRLRDAGLGESPLERARARLQSQDLLAHEVELARASTEASQLELQLALGQYVTAPSDGALEALRDARRKTESFTSEMRDHARIWRLSSNRERAAASEQLVLMEKTGDRPLVAVHRQRADLADATLQALSRLEQDLANVALLLEVAAERVVQGGGRIDDMLSRTWDQFLGLLEVAQDWTTGSLFEINDTPVTVIGLLRVAFILLLAWWVSKLLAGAIGRLMERRESMSRASLYTLQRLSTYLILAIGFFVGLSSIGIDFTKFALVISALGVGLGFGLQTIFSNFVAGLIILFEKSLKVGDFVELESGVHGEVREINIRSTLITTNDNIDILVPNSEFVNGRVTNWTLREAFRRMRVPFGVAYGTDKDLVKQAALEAAEATPYTLKNSPGREPRVWLVGFGDSSLDFELVVWLTTDAVKRPAAVNAAYTWELETALRKHRIEIPFPQRDLHLRTLFGARDDEARAIMGVRPRDAATGSVGAGEKD